MSVHTCVCVCVMCVIGWLSVPCVCAVECVWSCMHGWLCVVCGGRCVVWFVCVCLVVRLFECVIVCVRVCVCVRVLRIW